MSFLSLALRVDNEFKLTVWILYFSFKPVIVLLGSSLSFKNIYLTDLLEISLLTSESNLSVRFSFSSSDITVNPYFSKYLKVSLLTIKVFFGELLATAFNSASISEILNFSLS